VERVVVVGAGLAGAQVAVALRERGFRGRLTLVGAEPHRPYDRPPLSKGVLTGASKDSELDVDWASLDVELRLGEPAVGLDRHAVSTERGRLDYDAVVIATGALPIRLPAEPAADRAAITLRTIEDARAIRAALDDGAHLLVVGAGWIGAEVSTAAIAAGLRVTVLEAAAAPLAGALPAEFGSAMARWYAEAGVTLRLDAPVREVAGHGVLLADGARLAADLVVVGVGVRPATGWLAGSGLALDERGAVRTDPGLRGSLPNSYAVGDCAAYHSVRSGRPVHVQHWDNALRAGAVVAENLLGGDAVYDPAPYFWSEQFGRTVQYCGTHEHADQVVRRGDPDAERWAACWLRDGRLVGLLAVDRPRDLTQARRLIEAGTPLDAVRLADPETQLRATTLG
jgi:NADPH-dependent 2,4-dienoyl-CoA reductase/sulfur reductase-like enzyme